MADPDRGHVLLPFTAGRSDPTGPESRHWSTLGDLADSRLAYMLTHKRRHGKIHQGIVEL